MFLLKRRGANWWPKLGAPPTLFSSNICATLGHQFTPRTPFICCYAFDNTDLPKNWGSLVSGIVSVHFDSLACANELINPPLEQIGVDWVAITFILSPWAVVCSSWKLNIAWSIFTCLSICWQIGKLVKQPKQSAVHACKPNHKFPRFLFGIFAWCDLVPYTLEAEANPSRISCHLLRVNWQHQSEIWSEKYYWITISVNCNKCNK